MARLVAVTGVTGFVGPHLIAALARRGFKLRLLVRRWSPLPSLAGIDAEIILGDLEDPAALERLISGTDAVIHAAGLIKARAPADFFRVNRDATARLAALAPQPLFILEEALAGRIGPWLAVRAPAVYGPGDRETLAYFQSIARGIAPQPWLSVRAQLSLIHAADLAAALAACVERPLASSVYEIDDGQVGGYGYADMASAAATALGRVPFVLRIPRPLMLAAAAANSLRQSLDGSAQILTFGKVREIFHPDWSVHDRRLAGSLDFHAHYDLRHGFADTIDWYRRHKWI